MARGIQLRRTESATASHRHIRAWRLRVDVEAVNGGMDENVFLWEQGDPDPDTDEIVNEFVTVATVADMSKYPVGAANPEYENPYFRTNFFEIDLESQADYDWAWEEIQKAVGLLVTALDEADTLGDSEEVWIGDSGA